jgi:hypothetical protein
MVSVLARRLPDLPAPRTLHANPDLLLPVSTHAKKNMGKMKKKIAELFCHVHFLALQTV